VKLGKNVNIQATQWSICGVYNSSTRVYENGQPIIHKKDTEAKNRAHFAIQDMIKISYMCTSHNTVLALAIQRYEDKYALLKL
jgi:hypothetical protein